MTSFNSKPKVDVPLTEKLVGWFAWTEAENRPRVKF